MSTSEAGANPGGGFVGFGRTPLRDKEFFEAILVGRGLNLVRCDGKKTRKRTPHPEEVTSKKGHERLFGQQEEPRFGQENEPPQDNPASAIVSSM